MLHHCRELASRYPPSAVPLPLSAVRSPLSAVRKKSYFLLDEPEPRTEKGLHLTERAAIGYPPFPYMPLADSGQR
jgi:hypothetical protein